ncbi:type II toxin-antitoxin system prevent-host-death family antitoxin [Spirulina major]|uniref:type II toxin-antitoxin system prevent-host-death family antitoxin n=1 Tax=Spirulina major TaxID=270636 RepID=UPI000934242F|nr:type II toxin-antitoxin system prevent-host-death family antitoxin [Spirulina major]
MEHITDQMLNANLAATLNKVCDSHTPITITRSDGQAVVMLSQEEYESLAETAYLLRSPTNARRLLDSIAELGSGGGQERELIE